MVAGQQVALGRGFTGETVTVLVSETTLAVELDDGDVASSAAPPPRRCVASKGSGHGTAGTLVS